MKKLFSILGECERRLALAATGTRGGVDDSSARLLGGWAPWKLLALGVLLVGVIMVWPHSVPAQAVCTGVDNPTGTPPTVTISTSPNAQVKCTGLTGGLTLTTVKDSTITSTASSAKGIWVSQDGTGAVAITHAGTISADTHGILVDGDTVAAERHITIRLVAGSQITTRSTSSSSAHGVYAHIENNAATGDIKIIHDGTITARRVGILATNKGTGSVDVTTGKGSLITTKGISAGINASVREGSVKGTVTVTHKGTITSTDEGINASNRVATGTGGVTVTTAEGSAITAVEIGIYARHYGTGAIVVETAKGSKITSTSDASGMAGVYAWISNSASKGNIKITHNGMITAARLGVFAANEGTGNVDVTTGKDSSIKVTGESAGINASVRDGSVKGTVKVTHHGTIKSTVEGIYATNRVSTGTGAIMITAVKGSTITAETQGIRVRHDGTGKFDVRVRGEVMGGNVDSSNNKYAGVHVEGRTSGSGMGGTIVVGTRAHLSAESKVAIKVDANAGPVKIILERENNVVGHVDDTIENPGTSETKAALTFHVRGVAGEETPLKDGDTVWRRGTAMGIYDEALKVKFKAIEGGYKFEDVEGAEMQKVYRDQARLYEATAPILQGLLMQMSYGTRMATPRLTSSSSVIVESTKGEQVEAPQSRTGVWVRLAALEGDRKAKTSTTATDVSGRSLSWDIERTSVEIGLDVPIDDRLLLGVSGHWRQSEASMKDDGGTMDVMDVTGMGLGVSLTWTGDNELYVDGQLSYTRFFDIEMASNGTMITSTGSGSGVALGLEVGQPMSVGGLMVTPRGGLSWSSVKMDAFVEPTSLGGTGTVSPDRAESVMARVGVQAELGPRDGASRLYGSLDLEHEFRPEFEVMAGTTPLKGEVKPTWVRAGIGGAMPLGNDGRTMLAGDAFYATAGSGNADFGGGVALNIRF